MTSVANAELVVDFANSGLESNEICGEAAGFCRCNRARQDSFACVRHIHVDPAEFRTRGRETAERNGVCGIE